MAGIQSATVGVQSPTSGVNSGGGNIGNLQLQPSPMAQTQVITNPNQFVNNNTGTNTGGASTGSSLDIGSLLGSVIGTAANVYGSQNAAEAATHGNQAAITQQQQTLGNINTLYQPQQSTGNAAFRTLGSTLGLNGQPANYSNFLNMPGYQFAVQQGTQALQRQASAMGSAYTPNTAAAIGQYVTGTAMQDYNTYVNQLLSTGQFGAQANQNLTGANLTTGGNISQLMANIGQNQAGGYAGVAGAFGGPNGSGVNNFLNTGRQLYNYGKQAYNYLNSGPSAYGAVNTGTDAAGGYVDAAGNYIPSQAVDMGNTAADLSSSYSGAVDLSQSAGDLGGSFGNIDVSSLGFNSAAAGSAPAAAAGAEAGAGYGGATALTADQMAPISMDAVNSVGLADVGGSAASGAAGSAAADAAGSSAASGLTLSPGVAALPAAIMLAVAAHQNPTAFNQNYWNGINQTLSAGPGTGSTYGFNGYQGGGSNLGNIKQYTDYEGALASLGAAYQGQGQGNSTIPDSEWATLAQYGITPQNIGNLSMPDMGMQYWQNLSASSGVPMYSTPSRQGL